VMLDTGYWMLDAGCVGNEFCDFKLYNFTNFLTFINYLCQTSS
jgi:hypothetical protein